MTILGHRFAGSPTAIRIARAFVDYHPLAHSAAPFCAKVAGAERSTVMPYKAFRMSNLRPNIRSPSVLKNLTVLPYQVLTILRNSMMVSSA